MWYNNYSQGRPRLWRRLLSGLLLHIVATERRPGRRPGHKPLPLNRFFWGPPLMGGFSIVGPFQPCLGPILLARQKTPSGLNSWKFILPGIPAETKKAAGNRSTTAFPSQPPPPSEESVGNLFCPLVFVRDFEAQAQGR